MSHSRQECHPGEEDEEAHRSQASGQVLSCINSFTFLQGISHPILQMRKLRSKEAMLHAKVHTASICVGCLASYPVLLNSLHKRDLGYCMDSPIPLEMVPAFIPYLPPSFNIFFFCNLPRFWKSGRSKWFREIYSSGFQELGCSIGLWQHSENKENVTNIHVYRTEWLPLVMSFSFDLVTLWY